MSLNPAASTARRLIGSKSRFGSTVAESATTPTRISGIGESWSIRFSFGTLGVLRIRRTSVPRFGRRRQVLPVGLDELATVADVPAVATDTVEFKIVAVETLWTPVGRADKMLRVVALAMAECDADL